MNYKTFWKAHDIHSELASLKHAKEMTDIYLERLAEPQQYHSILERIFFYDQIMYKSIMKEISEKLEAKLFELNIEFEAI
jgi:hypothetical protein